MPQRAPSACRRHGCPGLVSSGVCSRCGPLRSQVQAAHDEQRGTAAQRGYGGRWQRLRLAFLSEHPLCAHCLAAGVVTSATDVHHLKPRRDGGLDLASNLQAVCHACHSRVTGAGG